MADSSNFFFTYFNSKFLIQGTVAINSFLVHHPDSIGYIYSDDQLVVDALQVRFKNNNVVVINLLEIPTLLKEIEGMKQDRNTVELLISLKPFLFLETLARIPADATLTYIDADLFFYQSLKPMLSELQNFDILLTKHIFPKSMIESVKYGQVNAGLISARRSVAAEDILTDWAAKCRSWCYLRLEDNKYADQLYLDAYLLNSNVKAIADPGINNGMYYFKERRKLTTRLKRTVVDGSELICFHFHGIRVSEQFVLTGFNRYNFPPNALRIWNLIFRKYISEIRTELVSFYRILGLDAMNNCVLHQLDDRSRILLKRFRRTLISSKTSLRHYEMN